MKAEIPHEKLSDLQFRGLFRSLPDTYTRPGAEVTVSGQILLSFCSNNYLGLATHPQVISESVQAVQESGCSATGSRLLSGNLDLHQKLEIELAEFKGAEKALLFNTGYSANQSVLNALTGPADLLVSDQLNHASLIDAARSSGGKARFFRHRNLQAADRLLGGACDGKKFLIVDGVFSMDGDIVALPECIEIARRHSATLIVDEAHSTGILGQTGRGTFEHFGLSTSAVDHGLPAIIQVGTLSKALGGFGGFVASDAMTCSLLINFARPFIYSTALPPAVLASSLAALKILKSPEGLFLLQSLRKNSRQLSLGLKALGFNTPESDTPIIPLILGQSETALAFAEKLRTHGIWTFAVRPPSVKPGTSRLRLTVMATHTAPQIEKALNAFDLIGKQFR